MALCQNPPTPRPTGKSRLLWSRRYSRSDRSATKLISIFIARANKATYALTITKTDFPGELIARIEALSDAADVITLMDKHINDDIRLSIDGRPAEIDFELLNRWQVQTGKRLTPVWNRQSIRGPSRQPAAAALWRRMSPRVIQLPLSGRDRRHYVVELRKAEDAHRSLVVRVDAAYRVAHRLACEEWNTRQFIGGDIEPSPSIADAPAKRCPAPVRRLQGNLLGQAPAEAGWVEGGPLKHAVVNQFTSAWHGVC
jgi:hypothetical protein